MKEAIKNGDVSYLSNIPDAFHLMLGTSSMNGGAGTIGEICALALLLGLAFMLIRKIITWHIPVSIIITVALLSSIMHLYRPYYSDPLSVILSGAYPEGMSFAILIMNAFTPLINTYIKPKRFGKEARK